MRHIPQGAVTGVLWARKLVPEHRPFGDKTLHLRWKPAGIRRDIVIPSPSHALGIDSAENLDNRQGFQAETGLLYFARDDTCTMLSEAVR